MRVTGGKNRGKRISNKGVGDASLYGAMRATSSKVREAIFNIIGPSIDGLVFADLYTGTGAVGMEAMSRQAGTVYFVEADRMRYTHLKDTLDGSGGGLQAQVRNKRAMDFLAEVALKGVKIDIVFLDPPYDSEELQQILPLLGEGEILADDALVLVEYKRGRNLNDEYGCLTKLKQYKYGETMLAKFKKVTGR